MNNNLQIADREGDISFEQVNDEGVGLSLLRNNTHRTQPVYNNNYHQV